MTLGILLKPTKRKCFIFGSLVIFFPLLTYLLLTFGDFIPHEKDIASLYLIPLLRWPLNLFDFLTAAKFSPKDCWICLPTVPEILFILVFDITVLYTLACLVEVFLKRWRVGRSFQS